MHEYHAASSGLLTKGPLKAPKLILMLIDNQKLILLLDFVACPSRKQLFSTFHWRNHESSTLPFNKSTETTHTFTISPTLTTSSGCLINFLLILDK